MGYFIKNVVKIVVNLTGRRYCTSTIKSHPKMKYLNVAEKNDAAKNIAGFLSRGTSRRREGLSPYNKIYEFDTQINGQLVSMVMTSVSGHLLNYEFASNFRAWQSCNPVALFDAPIYKSCKDGEKIKKTLEREITKCDALVIWTDCDREGENIGYEIINVCKAKKPNIRVFRATFSEITAASVFRAVNNLGEPNKNVSDAVDVRQEMDLRTGAAFTRLQTLHLAKVFPQKLANKLISYGSCQFPTLGFVVERYKDIENFIPEPFWKIKMEHTKDELTVDFHWDRDRLFVKQPVQTILEMCQENPQAKIISVISKPKSKWRPVPLDTVEMEKIISRKLKINAKDTMKIAERLYTQGYISYPRTETNIFPKELNLRTLVEQQVQNNNWGSFATRVLNEGGPQPRQGKKSDQAHPPIHPTKYADNLTGNEQRVYEYIVRHFLACVSKDAQGHETVIKAKIADETFTTKGLIILEKNYLEVYIYEKWNSKEVHNYKEGDIFTPTLLQMEESKTSAPKLLTEADLIALMEKNGIGTDATHADHIDTIKSREYVGLHENIYFIPGKLGMGLVEGYDNIGLEVSLAKPILRSEFESDLKLICEGRKDPQVVLEEQRQKYKAVFQNVINRMQELEQKLAERIEEQRQAVQNADYMANVENAIQNVFKCSKCGLDMILKRRPNQNGFYISCTGYPDCKNVVWLPNSIESAEVTNNICPTCRGDTKKIKVKFKVGQNPFLGEPNVQEICVGGCDEHVLQALGIPPFSVRRGVDNNQTVNNTRNQPPPPPPGGGASISTNNSTWNNASNRNQTNLDDYWTQSNGSTNRNQNSTTNDSGYNSWVRPNPSLSNTSTNSNNRWGGGSGNQGGNTNFNQKKMAVPSTDEDVVCNCGNPAITLTVRKEGPNKGRKFYKCDAGQCDFFLWVPDSVLNQTSTSINQNNFNDSSNFTQNTIPNCNCGTQAVHRITQKEGPNKGRAFYACSSRQCNFFKWASDVEAGVGGSGMNNSNSWGGSNNNNNWGNNDGNTWSSSKKRKRPANNKNKKFGNTGASKGKRKCGICGEEGHTRTNCPNKSQ